MITAAAILLVLLALFFTLAVRDRDLPEPIPVSPVQHLEDRKYAIYDNLRDLQFEYRLGKLSDADYQQNKQALQKELALVLAETEQTLKSLGLAAVRRTATPKAEKQPAAGATKCPHCRAEFPKPLKFCGECGKAMA